MISANAIWLYFTFTLWYLLNESTVLLIYSPKYLFVQSSSMLASVERTVFIRLLGHDSLFKIPNVN